VAEDSGWGAAAGAAVSTLGNYAVSVAANRKQFKYQQQAMDKQQALNKDLWDYQNAYNTPQAQMERLKAAGLNPNLIYGSGSAGAGNAGSIEPTEVPTRQAARADVPNGMFQYLEARQMDAQYKATIQNIDLAQKRGALMDVQTGLSSLKLFQENLRKKNYGDLAQAELDTRKFIALRSGELFANERTKGSVMDQLQQMRSKQMTSQELDNEFKKNRNELAKFGIYQSDDVKWRILLKAADRMGIDIGSLLAQGAQKLRYLFE